MKRPWLATLVIAARVTIAFWLVILTLAAIGVGPLSRFSPREVTVHNFDATIGALGFEQRLLEQAAVAPVLLMLSMVPLLALSIRPAAHRSAIVALPLAFLVGSTTVRAVVLWRIYSVAHFLVHLALARYRAATKGTP